MFDKWYAECREWWRLYSIRLAAAISALAGIVMANPSLLFEVAKFVPENGMARLIFSVAVAVLVFLVPTIARLWPQKNLENNDGK